MRSCAPRARLWHGAHQLQWDRHAGRRGASLVEFALVVPLFLVLLLGIAEGSWFVLEVSAISTSTRTTARWEVVSSNFGAGQLPDCALPSPSAAVVSPAKSAAGPFAGAITSSSITNVPVDNSNGNVIGCTVTIKVTYQPLEQLVRLAPSTISSSFTAYID